MSRPTVETLNRTFPLYLAAIAATSLSIGDRNTPRPQFSSAECIFLRVTGRLAADTSTLARRAAKNVKTPAFGDNSAASPRGPAAVETTPATG